MYIVLYIVLCNNSPYDIEPSLHSEATVLVLLQAGIAWGLISGSHDSLKEGDCSGSYL